MILRLLVDGKFVFNFRSKANLSDNSIASICTPMKNASARPSLSYQSKSRIISFQVTENEILLIIKSLDPNQVHGWYNTSIKMI